MKKKLLHFLLIALLLDSCASLTTPTGGPKDEDPPILLRSNPEDNQLNFKGKSIELTFDELVKLNTPKDEIIINPSPGKKIEFKTKGKQVIITPEIPWQDSTTYNIIFQEGIQDMTEGNSPDNLKLAFSTGPVIDTLSVSGTITDLLRGIPVQKITVALYSVDTFDIFTDIPPYFTKTDSAGHFTLSNIKSRNYHIYAFDDKNKNLKLETRAERYGFKSSTIKLTEPIDSLNIGLIMMDARPLKISAIRNTGNITRLRFNKFITDYELQMDTALTHAFGENQTELVIWNPPSKTDSLKIHLTATDSLLNKADSTFYVRKGDTKPINDEFKWSITEPVAVEETRAFTALIKLTKPGLALNFDSLFIPLDTINRISFTKDDITINSKQKEITLTKIFDKKIFDIAKPLKLTAGKGFIYSIDNDTSKVLAATITLKKTDQTGILLLRTETHEPNYIIQLISKEGKILASSLNETKISFKNLPPTECSIRIIIDQNKNGKWDPGNVLKNQEPENALFYITKEGTMSFPIRSNWELGPLIVKF